LILLGLTGSIGMGKTTTAAMFAAEGIPVYDADSAVHDLYGRGGAAVPHVENAFPGVVEDGAVHRGWLGERVLNNPAALAQLEAIVHPMVGQDRQNFFQRAREAREAVVVLDVPLLFETGGDKAMDAVVVASSPPDLQRERVLTRPGMTFEKLDAILKRQVPDEEKRRRADFVIDTSRGFEAAREQVKAVLRVISDPDWRSKRAD
jgi:dephospho-CoA kinase